MNKNDLLREALSTLDFYTPFLQTIPEVQEPDCTRLFQTKLDISAYLSDHPSLEDVTPDEHKVLANTLRELRLSKNNQY